jgi:hypothetical protein
MILLKVADKHMKLVQTLPDGPVDIIGDIHGEYDALKSLVAHLGYDADGGHAQGRRLVFVGDFCDRGPDSPAVLAWVERLVRTGRANAVLGNHEFNLLRDEPKDGAGWYFDSRSERDHPKYAPFVRCDEQDRAGIHAFLNSLPLALERADLRIVHAAWIADAVDAVRGVPVGAVLDQYYEHERALAESEHFVSLGQRKKDEQAAHGADLDNPDITPRFMAALAEYNVARQMTNPLRVLTSGVEQVADLPFYSGGSWRFVERARWWDDYNDSVPVVIGHYWRRAGASDNKSAGKGLEDLFDDVHPFAWHGRLQNVFCVDFSVGGRWSERKRNIPLGAGCKLAALRWPECVLQFDDGHVADMQGSPSR